MSSELPIYDFGPLPADFRQAYEKAAAAFFWAVELRKKLDPLPYKETSKDTFFRCCSILLFYDRLRKEIVAAQASLKSVPGRPGEELDKALQWAIDFLVEFEKAANMPSWQKYIPNPTTPIEPRIREKAWLARAYQTATEAVVEIPMLPRRDILEVLRKMRGEAWDRVEVADRDDSNASLPGEKEPLPAFHNADFTAVNWFGKEYQFALGFQSNIVKALWDEWERTGFGLHQGTICELIDSERESLRLDKVFRNHPAFGKMIQKSGDGAYKLAPQESPPGRFAPRNKKITKSPSKTRRKPG